MLRKIEALLKDQVGPALAAHGGAIELVDVDNNKVFIRLTGGCQGCSSSQTTVKQGIETLVKQNFPEIEEIVDITDHASGDKPYM